MSKTEREKPMTDEEVICTWMERMLGWWQKAIINKPHIPYEFQPKELDLDALHEVEARLTNEQWHEYHNALSHECARSREQMAHQSLVHASAEQKIKALAAVLRKEAEK